MHPINGGANPIRPRPPMPGPGKPTMMFASRAPMLTSKMAGEQGFVFRNNSAGLGVPRGSMGNLGKISPAVEHNGFVSRPAYVESPSGRAGGPVTVRAGAPSGGGGERGGEYARGGGNSGSGNSGSSSAHAGGSSSSGASSGGGHASGSSGGGGGSAPSGGGSSGGGAPAPSGGGGASGGHTGK